MPRPSHPPVLLACAVLLSLPWTAPAAAGYKHVRFEIHCENSVLLSASGIGKGDHQYEFKAACQLGEYGTPLESGSGSSYEKQKLKQLEQAEKSGLPFGPPGDLIKTLGPPVMVHGKGRWSPKQQTASEQLLLSGGINGELGTKLTGCWKDPFLRHGSACTGVTRSVQLDQGHPQMGKYAAAFSALGPSPLLQRAFEFDLALAYSNNNPAVPAPPPPKPLVRVPVITPQAGASGSVAAALPFANATLVLEAEALHAQGRVSTRGGQVSVQQMSGFGPGWGGNAQLLWNGGVPGSVLKLQVVVPSAGHYAIELRWTTAPDFGDVRVTLATAEWPQLLSGYAPKVSPAAMTHAGAIKLNAGTNEIQLRLVGKHALSSGFLFGIDQLRLTPVTR